MAFQVKQNRRWGCCSASLYQTACRDDSPPPQWHLLGLSWDLFLWQLPSAFKHTQGCYKVLAGFSHQITPSLLAFCPLQRRILLGSSPVVTSLSCKLGLEHGSQIVGELLKNFLSLFWHLLVLPRSFSLLAFAWLLKERERDSTALAEAWVGMADEGEACSCGLLRLASWGLLLAPCWGDFPQGCVVGAFSSFPTRSLGVSVTLSDPAQQYWQVKELG